MQGFNKQVGLRLPEYHRLSTGRRFERGQNGAISRRKTAFCGKRDIRVGSHEKGARHQGVACFCKFLPREGPVHTHHDRRNIIARVLHRETRTFQGLMKRRSPNGVNSRPLRYMLLQVHGGTQRACEHLVLLDGHPCLIHTGANFFKGLSGVIGCEHERDLACSEERKRGSNAGKRFSPAPEDAVHIENEPPDLRELFHNTHFCATCGQSDGIFPVQRSGLSINEVGRR